MRILIAIGMLLCSLVSVKHALHMFQQNRYELTRYTSWMKANLRVLTENLPVILCGAFGMAASLVLKDMALKLTVFGLSLAAGILALLKERRASYIKPLVYTDRVKRQIAVTAVLLIALVWFFSGDPFRTAYGLGIICMAVLPWLLIYLMALITSPIEKAVQNWYLNDAKRILREHTNLIKIGITGSYGKTSTKNVMQAVLSERFNSLMTPASYNTPMGITRTVRGMLKPIHQVFVCEMGADKVGDITELMEFVHPQIGVVTSIGPQHLQTFGSQENITREKMQMIELLPPDGLGIMNYDNELIRNWKLKNSVQTVSYAIDYEHADYRAADIRYSSAGSSFTLIHGDETYQFETKLLGKLNILNILSAIAASRYLGVDWKTIQRAVRSMKQVEHRLEQKKINGYNFIDDAFNANPSGAAMALDVLSGMPGTRYIVTPGMIDLGEKQDEINRSFGRQMKDKADVVILVGAKQTQSIVQGLSESGFDMDHVHVVDHVKEAFALIYRDAEKTDTILLENDLPDAFNN